MKKLKIWLFIIIAGVAMGVATYFIINSKLQKEQQGQQQQQEQQVEEQKPKELEKEELNPNNKKDKEGNRITQTGEKLGDDEGRGPVDWDTNRKKELIEDPMYKDRKKLTAEQYEEAKNIAKKMQAEGYSMQVSDDVWKDYNTGIFQRDTSSLKKISLDQMQECMQHGVEGVYKVDSPFDLEEELRNSESRYNVSMEYGEDQTIFAEEYNMYWAFAPASGIALRWSKDKEGDQIIEMKWIPAILAYSNQ